jgi:hypothetical protein
MYSRYTPVSVLPHPFLLVFYGFLGFRFGFLTKAAYPFHLIREAVYFSWA